MPLSSAPPLGTPMLPAGTYKGQVVYVTGGGTGLGKAIALEFARAGADVAIASRNPEHLKKGVDELKKLGCRAMGTMVDVRDTARIKASFDEVEKELGPITVLVNNAAGNFAVPAERMSDNAWRAVTSIVLDGTFYCSRELAQRRMADNRGGAILNIGATYSWTGGPIAAHSAAAKAGTMNLTMSLAVEWAADNIRVNCLVPGRFPAPDRTEHALGMAATSLSDQTSKPTVPAQRDGEAHELGWAATYICSPFAAYMSGAVIVLDGANWQRRYGLGMPEFETPRDIFDRSTPNGR